jgi:hypothetical protein
MTSASQVLLELICYASDRGKPAVLRVRPESISELCTRGLIEQREDGYWTTELGRGLCPRGRLSQAICQSAVTQGPVHSVSP